MFAKMFAVFGHDSLIWLLWWSVLLVTATVQYPEQNLAPKQRGSSTKIRTSIQIWSNPLLAKAPAILDTSSSTMNVSDAQSTLINTKFRSVNKLKKILNAIRFDCTSRSQGYYADLDFGCRIFHYCGGYNRSSRFTFICPGSSRFSQKELTCANDLNQEYDNCEDSERYFIINKFIYDRVGYENEILILNQTALNDDSTTPIATTSTVPPSNISNTTMFTVQNQSNSTHHRQNKPYNPYHRQHYRQPPKATTERGKAIQSNSHLAEKGRRMAAPPSTTEITFLKNQIDKPNLFPLQKHENRYSASTMDTWTKNSMNIYSIRGEKVATTTAKPKTRKSLMQRPKQRIKKKQGTMIHSNSNAHWPRSQTTTVYRKPLMSETDPDRRNPIKPNQAFGDYNFQQPDPYENNMVLVYYPLLYGNSNPYGTHPTPYSSNVFQHPLRPKPKSRSKMDSVRKFPRSLLKFRKELRKFWTKRFFGRTEHRTTIVD